MARNKEFKWLDLQKQLSEITSGVNVIASTAGGGGIGGGTVSNADTVDGFHASSIPEPNVLLALNSDGQFPTTVIDWSSVDHNSLNNLTAGNPHTQYINAAGTGLAREGQVLYIPDSIAGSGLSYSSGILNVNAGSGLTISSDTIIVDPSIAGLGLSYNSGTLSINVGSGLTISSNTVILDPNVAGSGLSYSSGVLNVNVGNGITISSDTVILDPNVAGNGLTYSSGVLHVRAGDGITVSADAVSLTTPGTLTYNTTNNASGNHTHAITTTTDASANPNHILRSDASGNLKLNVLYAATKVQTSLIDSQSGTALTLQPDQAIRLNPQSDKRVLAMSNVALQSDGYISQTTGWRITYDGKADFRYIYATGLHVKAFIADPEQALAGNQVVSKSVAVLAQDFILPSAGSSADFYVEDLPGAPDTQVFQSGDWVRFRIFSRSAGSLTITDAWGTVSNYVDQTDGTQRWTFTRSSSAPGSASGTVPKGSLVLDYGTSGDGFWEINAADGSWFANSPYAQTAIWSTVPTNQTITTRIGNLRTLFSTSNEYGLYAGNGIETNSKYLRISNQEAQLHNISFYQYHSTTSILAIDPSGPYLAVGSPNPTGYLSASGFWIGRHTDGSIRMHLGTVENGDITAGLKWDGSKLTIKADIQLESYAYTDLSNVEADTVVEKVNAGTLLVAPDHVFISGNTTLADWRHASDLTKIDGNQIYAHSITAEKLRINEGSGNMCLNGDFSLGNNYWTMSGAAITADTPYYGPRCLEINAAYGTTKYAYQDIRVAANKTYTISAYYCSSNGIEGNANPLHALYIEELNFSYQVIATHRANTELNTGLDNYKRLQLTITADSDCAYLRIYAYVRDCTGTWRWDCFQVERGSFASPWKPSSASNIFIDSGHILIGTPSSARIELNNYGIEGYSDAATKEFYIRAADGKGVFGNGKNILDSTGLTIWGSENNWQTYSAIRWQDGSNEPAAIGAGLFASNSRPNIVITSNRNRNYAGGVISLISNNSTSPYSASITLDSTSNENQIFISASGATGNPTISLDSSTGIDITVADTQTLDITGSVLITGNVGVGIANPPYRLSIAGALGILEGGASPTYYTVFQGGNQSNNIVYTLPTTIVAGGYLKTDASGVLSWSIISGGGGGGSSIWSDLLDPVSDLSLHMGPYTTTFTWSNETGNDNLMTLTDTVNNTGTGYLLNIETANGSTLNPLRVSANEAETLIVTAEAKVGIGTDRPAERLEVVGNIKLLNPSTKRGEIYAATSELHKLWATTDDFTASGVTTSGQIVIDNDEIKVDNPAVTVSASSASNATAHSLQRKTWYDGTRYWSALNANNRIEFWFSTDKINWSENTNARINANTSDFSIEASSNSAIIAYKADDGCIYSRIATSYPATDFSWSDASRVFNAFSVSLGTDAAFYLGSVNDFSTAVLNSTKFVIGYRSGYNSYGIVGSVSGSDITFGTAATFHTTTTANIKVVSLDETKVAIAFRDTNGYGTALIGSISGTTITFGSKYVFNNATTNYISTTALSSTKFVAVYADAGNSNYGTAIVGNVSGTTITFGPEYVFSSTTTYDTILCTLDSTRVLIIYRLPSSEIYARIGTISGTSITFGTAYLIRSGIAVGGFSATVLDSSHFIVSYLVATIGCLVKLGTVSGSSITFGREYLFEQSIYSDVVFSTVNSNHFAVGFRQVYYGIVLGKIKIGTLIGSDIVFSDSFNFFDMECKGLGIVTLNQNQVLVTFLDNNGYGKSKVVNPEVTGLPCSHVYITKDSNGNPWALAQIHRTDYHEIRAITTSNTSSWPEEGYILDSSIDDSYGAIAPLDSGDVLAIWTDGQNFKSIKYDQDTTWESSNTLIDTSPITISKGFSIVTDSNNNVHFAYIDRNKKAKYRKYTTSWQNAVVLDNNIDNLNIVLSLDTANSKLYAFWIRDNNIYVSRGASPYTQSDWTIPYTWQKTNSGAYLNSNARGSEKIFVTYTDYTSSTYVIKFKEFLLSGDGYWLSETLDAGQNNTYIPNQLTVYWRAASDDVQPKFQILASSTGDFSGEETIYPAGSNTFYQHGGTYNIDNGVPRDLSSEITNRFRYWKIKVYLDTGSSPLTIPAVCRILLRDSCDLILQTNGQFVGIGKSNPMCTLDVNGEICGKSFSTWSGDNKKFGITETKSIVTDVLTASLNFDTYRGSLMYHFSGTGTIYRTLIYRWVIDPTTTAIDYVSDIKTSKLTFTCGLRTEE